MNKKSLLLLCLMLLSGVWHSVQAALVEVKMNSVTKTMILQDAQGNPVNADSNSGTTYVFNNLPANNYTLFGYNSSSELNGTFTFEVGDSDMSLQIWTIPNISVSNDGWVYGTDYTIENLEVHSREGATFTVTLGDNAGTKSVLTHDGGSVILRFAPTPAREAEGYVSAWDGKTITGNANIIAEMPMGGEFSSSCPADAEIAMMQKMGGALGSGTIHYVPFSLIEPKSVVTSGDAKTYTWRLGQNCQYNMRAWRDGSLTQLLYFYYNTDPSKCPVINFTEQDFAARDPKWIDHNPRNLDRMNDCNILININEKGYLKMTAGQDYDLMAERDWQIIPNQTENYFLEPDYHYAVYDINGNPDNSVVEIVPDGYIGSEWAILRAKAPGTAIVTITYDAASASQYQREKTARQDYYGGRYFGALWPENTAVFVVSVDAESNSMVPNMFLNKEYNEDAARLAGINVDAEHDVFYYINDEESAEYTFHPDGVQTVEISYPTIRTNDAVYNTGWHSVTKNNDNTYTLRLKHGRQIVRMGDGAGNYIYQVLTAKHATRTITNRTNASTTRFLPGSNVVVQYDGLFHPANKLSGIYNMSAYITYNGNPTGSSLILSPNQYWFAGTPSAQAVSFTIPTDYTGSTYTLSDGVIQVLGYGDPIGNHRTIGKWSGRSPNFTAGAGATYFGTLPDIVIPVTQPAETRARFICDPADAEIIKVTNSLGVEVTADGDGRYLLKEGENTVVAHHPARKRAPITVTINSDCPAECDIPLVLETIPDNGWNGTDKSEPTKTNGIYHIKNGAELAWFANQVNTVAAAKTYKAVLDNDIDLCGFNWTPIGNSSKKFAGEFDGQGYTIDNLHIESANTYLGLFGALTYASATASAVVKNFVLRGSIISMRDATSTSNVGSVTGYAQSLASRPAIQITNVISYVNVTATSGGVAGLVGNAKYVNIDRCANYGNIISSNSSSTNQVRDKNVAGLVFFSASSGTAKVGTSITNSYNCGNVIGGNYVGGIYATGEYTLSDVTVTNCYNTGYVNATKSNSLGSSMGAIRNAKYTTDETPLVTNAYSNADFLFNELNTIIVEDETPWQSGEIAYKLGSAFGQHIGVDPLPVIGGKKVYEKELSDGRLVYTNDPYEEYIRDGLTAGNMGTICLPWASDLYTGATFYKILYKELDGAGDPYNITLEEVTSLEPGVPYIFVPEEDAIHVYYFSHTAVLNPSQTGANGLYGTFKSIIDGAAGASGNKLEGKYVVANNKFKKCGAYCQLPENRAYIIMNDVPVNGAANAPKPNNGRRHIVIGNANAPQTPTAIDEQRVNDQMNQCYDMLGRPVDINSATHGVYIINGQKIVK